MDPELLQIVPHLPPSQEGVGSYAERLGAQLTASYGIVSRFFAPLVDGIERRDDWVPRSPEMLVEILGRSGASAVLLHYVNYGYHSRGCPSWLVRGVTRWREASRERRLIVYFHEVYAKGPPWTSSFWLSPRQRALARKLAQTADQAVTSNEVYANSLRRWAHHPPVVLPMASTVGEPANIPRQDCRRPELVVFGGTGTRGRAFSRFSDDLQRACHELHIEHIVDIGPEMPSTPGNVGPLRVERLGLCSATVISEHLTRSRAAFIAYPQALLGKSTVFAAYCAHGAVAVCPRGLPHPATGGSPSPGVHFLDDSVTGLRPGMIQAVADRAWQWYRGHDLAAHASVIATSAFSACAS